MIKIIDYKAGNAPSVMHAVRHLGFNADFAKTANELTGATHIILPGVGSAKATMESLRESELIDVLEEMVLKKKVSYLGICVGLQILFQHSEEDDTKCLGWLKGNVIRFDSSKLRVPQMGWNEVSFIKETLYENTRRSDYFYFVNSYYAVPDDKTDIWAQSDYGIEFTAAVQRDNICATQFHIEKSGEAGLGLLHCFLTSGGALC